jgi:hypothetical protein
MAFVGLALCATVWVLSWLPGFPLAGVWPALLVPAGALLVLPFAAVILESVAMSGDGTGRAPFRGPLPVPVHGWRAAAVVAAFVVAFGGVALMFVGVGASTVKGTPFEDDGRYYTRVPNEVPSVTEISEDDWRSHEASTAGFFAGVLLCFTTISAMSLSAPPGDEERRRQARLEARLGAPRHADRLSWPARVFGRARVHEHVPVSIDAVVARFAQELRTSTSAPDASGRIRFVADWDLGMPWPIQEFPVLVDAELIPAGASTELDVALRPATAAATLSPVGGIGALVLVGLGLAVLQAGARATGSPIVVIFAIVWAGAGLFSAWNAVTVPSRAARRAGSRILLLARHGPPPPGQRWPS